MIRFDPDTLYTRDDLQALLAEVGINADMFVARLRPKKVFRAGWLGEHLLEAFREAPALADHNGGHSTIGGRLAALPAPANRGNRRPRAGIPKDDMGMGALEACLDELKAAQRSPGNVKKGHPVKPSTTENSLGVS